VLRLLRSAVGRFHLKRMPWHLLLGALGFAAVGAAFIRSAHSADLASKHLVFAAAGACAFLVLSVLDYRKVCSFAVPFYAFGILALAGLFVYGVAINNARRWYNLGFFHAQPSEAVKYILVIALAHYFSCRDRLDRFRDALPALALTGLPMLLIMKEPDFGTSLVLVPVFGVMSFLAGVRIRHLAAIALAGLLLLAAAWFTPGVLHDYQRGRVLAFINPGSDPDSVAAYNAEQATMAIRSGGMNGQGWGRGVLNRLGRVPERYADFIFPVIAEEWGFWRTALLMAGYWLFACFVALVALTARHPMGRLLASGVLTLFVVQSLLHMAISLRLAPITGLTLPLVSYGGSSLMSTFGGLGLVSSVATHPADDLFEG
jgi:rod shape determining protein RodA